MRWVEGFLAGLAAGCVIYWSAFALPLRVRGWWRERRKAEEAATERHPGE